jgi:NAD(P)-dependent dehydrogenase (short-subunit alcohol dehydrogenase family)
VRSSSLISTAAGQGPERLDVGLQDRVVLITGAGGGAGPTLARAFAAEGAAVALHQRSASAPGEPPRRAEAAAADIVANGGRAAAFAAELTSSDQIEAMVSDIESRLGPVAVLVTATSAYSMDRFSEIPDQTWASVLDNQLGATFRTCRAVVPGMVAAKWGRIVNIAARSGLVGASRAAHYAAAKAGIVGLTVSLAKELGPSGVLVNAVAPVQIQIVKDGVPSFSEEQAAQIAKRIPLRRMATPDDLAALVVWLGSGANTFVSGETVSLTGGDQR